MDILGIATLRQQAASLLIYREIFAEKAGQHYLALLRSLHRAAQELGQGRPIPSEPILRCLRDYGAWFQTLAAVNQSWRDYLITQILKADNPFSRQVQQVPLDQLPSALITAVQQDLRTLEGLAHSGSEKLSQWVQAVAHQAVVVWAPGDRSSFHPLACTDWAEALPALASYYQQQGTGLLADYRALRWQGGQLMAIAHPDPVQLSELVGYEQQRALLVQNTEHLLAGYQALHVLLYGSRGSGKSSLVKALLNEYGDRGLRGIEVAKANLYDLPQVVDLLREVPQKCIIFVDDLSFEEDDDAYKALKVVLQGNLTAQPQNVVVYATSNRRHLIREFFGDRPRPQDSDEIQAWDTVQEKLSFSDRFGLTLTFEPADQGTYLAIVRHLAAQTGLNLEPSDLEYRALQWATRHNGRSGRTARQFIDFLQAQLARHPL